MLLDPLPASGGAGTVNRSASMAPSQALPEAQPQLAAVVLATALACALTALFPLFFSGQVHAHHAAWPLNPAAGVALAAALTYGRAALWGVALGAFTVQLGLAFWRTPDDAHIDTVLPALLALTAALQASLGAAFLRRFLPPTLRLQTWAEIVRAGFFGALLACALGAAVATTARQFWGPLTAAGTAFAPSDGLSTWIADSLGVLIVAPLVLTWIGRPRAVWQTRQSRLGLPLLVALALLGVGAALLRHSEELRTQDEFDAGAARLTRQAETRLHTITHALQAVHGALRALPSERPPDSETLWQAAQWWWTQPMGLHTVALALRDTASADKLGGEETVELSEHTALRYRIPAPVAISAAISAAFASASTTTTIDTLPSHFEAQAPRAALAGLHLARRHGDTVTLTEPLPGLGHSSASQITLVQALYRGRAVNDAARQALFRGYLLLSFDLQQALAGLEKSERAALHWCLYSVADRSTSTAPVSAGDVGISTEALRLLAGLAACPAQSLANPVAPDRLWQQRVRLADRELLLQVHDARRPNGGTMWLAAVFGTEPANAAMRGDSSSVVRSPVLLLALCSVAALAALLLGVTGSRQPADLAESLGCGQSTPIDAADSGANGAARTAFEDLPQKLEPLALQPFLQNCLERVQSIADQRKVLLSQPTLGEATEVLGVQADRTQLAQVMSHLLHNAIQYNDKGGAVVVHAECVEPGLVELSVADTGQGMNAAQMVGLFEPHTHLERGSGTTSGAGKSLIGTRRLVEKMGGTLEAQSQAGVGTTFKLRLPRVAVTGLDFRDNTTEPLANKTTQAAQRQVHCVDHQAGTIDILRAALQRRSQVVMSTSSLGLDALSAIRQQRPDLVLLNAQLPDINGLELLRHFKQDPGLAHVPVILVSNKASAELNERAIALGALQCVGLPLDEHQFLAWVDHALADPDRSRRPDPDRSHHRSHHRSQDRNQDRERV